MLAGPPGYPRAEYGQLPAGVPAAWPCRCFCPVWPQPPPAGQAQADHWRVPCARNRDPAGRPLGRRPAEAPPRLEAGARVGRAGAGLARAAEGRGAGQRTARRSLLRRRCRRAGTRCSRLPRYRRFPAMAAFPAPAGTQGAANTACGPGEYLPLTWPRPGRPAACLTQARRIAVRPLPRTRPGPPGPGSLPGQRKVTGRYARGQAQGSRRSAAGQGGLAAWLPARHRHLTRRPSHA
jgi:hypothetical protein